MPAIDTNFLRACRCEPTDRTPIWFMRQAGRSLPEYRALREEGSILDAIRNPELAIEISMQPIRRYGVDAAILFSDIVVPLVAIGLDIDIVPGRGPVIEQPFRSSADIDRLREFNPAVDAPYVGETVAGLVAELAVPLIGFAGAPFTIASYLVEGGPSKSFARTKAFMHEDPDTWLLLLDRLASIALASLRNQVASGASAIQLFDSWVGALSREDYTRFVLPSTTRIFSELADLDVPRIHFGVGTGELIDLMAGAGADVVGVDWRTPLDRASKRCGDAVAIQGNLDPDLCLSSFDIVEREALRILDEGTRTPGHIFNLGHGVLPSTDPTILEQLVGLVHTTSIETRKHAPQ